MDSGVLRGRIQESFLAINVSSSTGRTLSAVEALVKTIRFTGTLAQDITIRVPVTPSSGGGPGSAGYTGTFENQTVGGYTVTIAPITGGSVDIPSGAAVTCFYDGTDFIGAAAAAATALPATIGDAVTYIPIEILDPVIGDAIFYDGSVFTNQPSGGGGQVVITVNGNVILDAEQAAAANIELRAGSVAVPFSVTFPDASDGKAWIVENTTGQPCTLIGNDGSQSFLVNNARCQVLWDGATLMRQWLSTPTHFNYAGSSPITFTTWDEVDADYIEFSPVAGNVTVNWPNGGSLGKRGRRQTIKNDHTSSYIDVKTNGAGADKTTRLLPGETASFIIDDSGALVPDWTRAFERRVAITHDNTATYTVLHPDFLAKVLVIGGSLTLTRNLVLPTVSHHSWLIRNATGQNLVVKTAAGGGVTVVDGNTAWLGCDGTDIVALAQPAAAVPLLAQANLTRLIMGNIADWLATGNFSGMRLDVQGDVPTLYMDAKNGASPFRMVPPTSGVQYGTAATDLQAWHDGTPSVQMVPAGATTTKLVDSLLTQMSVRGLIGKYVSPYNASAYYIFDSRTLTGAHNDPIGSLTDVSGNSRTPTAAGGNRGTLQVTSNTSPNGSQLVRFDGVDDTYTITTTDIPTTSGVMFTFGVNIRAKGAAQVIWADDTDQRPQLIPEGGTSKYAFRDENGGYDLSGAFAAGWQVLQYVFRPPTGGTGICEVYRNGVSKGTHVWQWNEATPTGWRVSGNGAGNVMADMDLGCIIITPGNVSDATRLGLAGWVNSNFG